MLNNNWATKKRGRPIKIPFSIPISPAKQKKKAPQNTAEPFRVPAATTCTRPQRERLVVRPGPVTIEALSEKNAFTARLKQRIQTVDFDDIDTSDSGPVPFDSDRYAASAGVIIKGTDGQYVDESFGWPDEFKPGSPPNMYAPGPPATDADPPPRGGHRTEITFTANGSKAAVAGFGAVFIDADYPCIGPCVIRAFDCFGKELVRWSGFAGHDGSQLFRGIIAVNDKGDPVPAIFRVEIINGNEWPSVDAGEGVTLDDFVFSAPVPVVPIPPERTRREGSARWKTAAGGNGHFYKVVAVPEGITWIEANRRAIAAGGHLATITSKAENDFVFALADQPECWNRMDGGPWLMGPWIGGVQAEGAPEPNGGWQWVTGEPFEFANWRPGDPNDDCRGSGAVNRICFYTEDSCPSPLWCDAAINSTYNVSYVVEFDRFGTSGER